MKTLKLVVTHGGRLTKKYGAAGRKKIETAVASLVGRDRQRDITTHSIRLDEPADAARYGFATVTGKPTSGKCKAAIDRLFASLSPDYLVILGSPDVIPQFDVANPTYLGTNGDDDVMVPTDNPYACSKPFRAKDRASYLIPDRVVGRIPDLPGSNEPAWLLDYLSVAEAWKVGVARDYADDLMVCCDAWKVAGEACVTYLARPAERLMISPPTEDASAVLRGRHGAPLHMIKCHGQSLSATFSGQKGNSYPDALVSTSIQKRTARKAVVGAMCCYGSVVFDPNDPAALLPGAPPIPSVYLKQGAYGFMGSTTIAWVGVRSMQCADWLVAGWLRSILRGASLGHALLEAKQDLFKWVNQRGETPGLEEEKTLLQFQLLGDPSIHILPRTDGVPAAATSVRAAGPRAGRTGVAIAGLGTADERRARREFRHETARQLREALPIRRTLRSAPVPARGPAVARGARVAAAGARSAAVATPAQAFRELASSMKRVKFAAPVVQRVTRPFTQPELVPAAARRVSAAGKRPRAAQTTRDTIEYYWMGRDRKAEKKAGRRVVAASLIKVETDTAGNVLRTKVLVSS